MSRPQFVRAASREREIQWDADALLRDINLDANRMSRAREILARYQPAPFDLTNISRAR